MTDIYDEKKTQSIDRLTLFAEKLRACKEINGIDGLTIFTSGSYARNEASKFSDIDLFFLVNRTENGVDDIKLKSIQLFAKIIEISQELNFPEFSNDGEYLKLIQSDSILENLGGQRDDYDNHFTTRMLFLLESKCIYNEQLNDHIMEEFIESYFRDYPRHPSDFKPIFLINDIIRF